MELFDLICALGCTSLESLGCTSLESVAEAWISKVDITTSRIDDNVVLPTSWNSAVADVSFYE
jgi:hypothetical protein